MPAAATGSRPLALPLAASEAPLVFADVYAEYFSFVWKSLKGLGVAPAFIDDAAQDCFIIAYRKLHLCHGPQYVRSWLYGIARRVAKDHRRAMKRRGVHVELDEARSTPSEKDTEEALARRQTLRSVEDFLASLEEEDRALFVLSEIHQLPMREASDALELNMNTAYARLRTIRMNLALHLSVHAKGNNDER